MKANPAGQVHAGRGSQATASVQANAASVYDWHHPPAGQAHGEKVELGRCRPDDTRGKAAIHENEIRQLASSIKVGGNRTARIPQCCRLPRQWYEALQPVGARARWRSNENNGSAQAPWRRSQISRRYAEGLSGWSIASATVFVQREEFHNRSRSSLSLQQDGPSPTPLPQLAALDFPVLLLRQVFNPGTPTWTVKANHLPHASPTKTAQPLFHLGCWFSTVSRYISRLFALPLDLLILEGCL